MAWLRRSFKRETLVGLYAPELPDIDRRLWINSEPVKFGKNKDKLIMIDFWTYSCINCLRTLPSIKKWHERYAKDGLLIIGVHSPEFDFEKKKENVELFVRENGIEYPVVMDNDYEIWHAFENQFWPRKLLVDNTGRIVFDHIGEGAYAETEKAIQRNLEKIRPELRYLAPAKVENEVKPGAVCYPMTPETYCGYERGLCGNPDGFMMDKVADYKNEVKEKKDGLTYIDGMWESRPEFLRYAGQKPGGYLEIFFRGVEVNAVMGTSNGNETKVILESDGKPLEKGFAGEDVFWDENGRSAVTIEEEKMYRLISADLYLEQKLRLYPQSSNWQIYAFTFGSCTGT